MTFQWFSVLLHIWKFRVSSRCCTQPPVLGRNSAGLGLGKGAERFGVPPSSFCVPSFDVLRESRFLRDKKKKTTKKLSAPQGGGTTQARRFPGD